MTSTRAAVGVPPARGATRNLLVSPYRGAARVLRAMRAMVHRVAGVRLRAAIAAAGVTAVALALALGLLLVLFDRALTSDARASASSRAVQLSTVLASGNLLDLSAAVVSGPGERSVVQVLRIDGTVVAASPELAGRPALSLLKPAPGQEISERLILVDSASTSGEPDDPYAVVVRGVTSPQGRLVVIAGQSLVTETNAIRRAALLLGGLAPLLVMTVALMTFWLVGRALAPVEDIRRTVARISAADLDSRVPVPPAQDEVSRLAATMNQTLDRLRTAQQAQRRFIADASHELRSPLATVRTAVEVALAHPEASDLSETAGVVLSETARLDRLVADLLLLARADERGLPLRLVEVDLDDLVGAERRRIKTSTNFTVAGSINPVRLLADTAGIERVLRNLVDNAVRHTRTTIWLECRVEADQAVIVVADDGAGIPEESRAEVFDRFVRLDASRARGAGGTGLGLAITAELVTAHGGMIALGSTAPSLLGAAGGGGANPGASGGPSAGKAVGAQFTVRLPLGGPPQVPVEPRSRRA